MAATTLETIASSIPATRADSLFSAEGQQAPACGTCSSVRHLEPPDGISCTLPSAALPLVGELGEIIARRRQARPHTMRTGETALSVCVFHRHGAPIRDFRGAWETACIAAGFARPKVDAAGRPVLNRKGQPIMKATLIFHDLRRSAVRNLMAAGVDQSVAMRVTGHQTISVFQRYRIVSDDDVRAALVRTQAALGGGSGTVSGHNPGHNGSTEAPQSSGGPA